MAALTSIPSTTVDTRNFADVFPEIQKCLRRCHYVGLDLELSGIGRRGDKTPRDLNERYAMIKNLAETRGVISLGLSMFRYMTDKNSRRKVEDENGLSIHPPDSLPNWCLRASLFNILCKPPGNYTQDEDANKFLEGHRFDFQRQSEFGVPYSRTWHDGKQDYSELTVNRIFDLLVLCKKPIVFHNGFLDLVFFYSAFFGSLPNDVNHFRAHLKELFPSGIYDTKFFSVILKMNPNYLEYAFYNEQRLNLVKMKNRKRCVLVSPEEMKNVPLDETESEVNFVSSRNMFTNVFAHSENKVCHHFADYGWCERSHECPYEHNVDAILDFKEKQECAKHRGGDRATESLTSLKKLCYSLVTKLKDTSDTSVLPTDDRSNAHDAAFDAFMTGFTFACILNHLDTADRKFSNYVNRVFLTGSKDPFLIKKSEFTRISENFKSRLERITG